MAVDSNPALVDTKAFEWVQIDGQWVPQLRICDPVEDPLDCERSGLFCDPERGLFAEPHAFAPGRFTDVQRDTPTQARTNYCVDVNVRNFDECYDRHALVIVRSEFEQLDTTLPGVHSVFGGWAGNLSQLAYNQIPSSDGAPARVPSIITKVDLLPIGKGETLTYEACHSVDVQPGAAQFGQGTIAIDAVVI